MERTRRQLLDWMARDISTEDLERISKTLPYILQEAVREINGEVRYEMHELTQFVQYISDIRRIS
jgi:hypothetical protein